MAQVENLEIFRRPGGAGKPSAEQDWVGCEIFHN